MPSLAETGEEGFLAGLRRCGCQAENRRGVIVFTVTAVTGPLAGREIETGVASTELVAWASAPPHWIHLPMSVTIPHTNTQASPVPGWLMHSRSITGWGDAAEPAQAWLAHARSVLGDAS